MNPYASQSLISQMPEPLRAKVLAAGVQSKFQSGQMIHLEGDVDAGLSIIREGSVKISRSNSHGEEIVVAVLGSGETYGEHPLFAGIPSTHDATAVTEATIIEISKIRFFRLMDEEPDLRNHALKAMTFRVIRALNLLDDERRLPANTKVAKYLLNLCETKELQQTLSITQSQMAEALNISRMTVSTSLKELQRHHIIKIGFGEVRVTDLKKLEQRMG